ncbi:MAG: hypothetical protein ACEB74_02030 [Desulfovibrio aminophilus]|uniref:hypothetical protein n=1 Tax=Desulfovibrio aminophilus TaxID=81425 RepID=UPI0039E93AA3
MRKNRPRGEGYVRKTVTLAAYDWKRLGQIMEAMTDNKGDHPSRAAVISEAIAKLWVSQVQCRVSRSQPTSIQRGLEVLRRKRREGGA